MLAQGGGLENEDFGNLSERKKRILIKAVEDYIQQASPITSGAVQNKFEKKVSTATLRNELNALEAMGFLRQLHTSGGRVPTSKGYRFYVNSMMGDIPLDKKALADIQTLFNKRTVYLGDIVSEIASVVSKATNYPTVVMLHGFDKLIVKNIKIIPLLTGQALILIETNSGVINNTMDVKSTVVMQTFTDASNFLTKTFENQTIASMIKNMNEYQQNMNKELAEFKEIFDALLNAFNGLTEALQNNSGIIRSGELKLLENPEYTSNPEKAKKVLDAISNAEEINKAMEISDSKNDVNFKIGSEIGVEDLQDCAIATTNYEVDGQSIASVGIIGPQRMDYGKIASALKFVVGEFQNMKALQQNVESENKEGKEGKS